jgi:hypothetical protein
MADTISRCEDKQNKRNLLHFFHSTSSLGVFELNSDSEQLFNTSTPKNGSTSGGGETVIIVSARPEQAFDKISDQHCI